MSPRDWASASYRHGQAVGNSMTEPVMVGLAVCGSRDLVDGNAARIFPMFQLCRISLMNRSLPCLRISYLKRFHLHHPAITSTLAPGLL
ncbi:hypothetical protein Q7C36_020956 [Tachysurus vachellii]|uniref:Uncharacterized protein n=1 Tax=Tachysurus vachellii TaxID=175792 RepID=A0AA88J7Y8_TACVA|nr:hypothetical protein Q7C36_020956 [Tachysurus vachellii]